MTNPGGKVSKVAFDTQGEATGGLACPKCGTRIPMTIHSLLVERRFVCPNSACGGILTLDATRSHEALRVLERFRDATKPD